MKILLISSTNNNQNGYGNITHEYCLYLQRAGIDFKLLLPKNEKRYEYTSYPVEYVLPDYIFNMRTPKILEYFFFSYKTDADIIHSLFEFPYAIIGAKLARKYKKTFIVGTQGTYAIKPLFSSPDKYILKWVYKRAALITAPSAFTKEGILKYSNTKTPVKIIHNAVNLKRFDKSIDTEAIREKYNNKKLLITVGGLKPRKGQDIVLEALALLKVKRDDFHYLIIGPNEKRSDYLTLLDSIIEKSDLKNNVTFMGAVEGNELVTYFHAAYVYVHTPRLINWNFEGFGIVYLEASACRKAIVAANSGGVPDAVIDGKTGIIVPEEDPVATAAALERLLDNPTLVETMGNAGYEYAKVHTWEIIGQQFLDIYKELI